MLQVEQLRQRIQILALCPAGQILVVSVVVEGTLVDYRVLNPRDEQPFRAAGAHGCAKKLLIPRTEQRIQFVNVGADELVVCGTTH